MSSKDQAPHTKQADQPNSTPGTPENTSIRLPEPKGPVIPEQQSGSSVVTHVMTDTESSLIYMAANEKADWAHAIETLDEYELMRDPFAFPDECNYRRDKKEFAYRWLNPDDKERFMVQTNPSAKIRWWLCTRTTSPYIPDRYFDVNGLVRNMGMVLAKMPWTLYMARQMQVWTLATPAEKVGEKAEGYEYTGKEGGKIRSGDVIFVEEKAGPDGVYMDKSMRRASKSDVADT